MALRCGGRSRVSGDAGLRDVMTSQLLLDAAERPDLFSWIGPIAESSLREWLANQGLVLPEDLVELLCATGGGDAFETETILGPHGRADLGDDFVGANEWLHDNGLPQNLVAFHRGLFVSAIDRSSGAYVTLAESRFTVVSRFSGLEEWYADTLRAEYGARYGLPDVSE